MSPKRLQTLFLKIAVGRYHFLKFILEGYDGLAILSKVEDDIVVLRFPCELQKDIHNLLSDLAVKVRQPRG